MARSDDPFNAACVAMPARTLCPAMLVAFHACSRRGGFENRRDRTAMQSSGGYFVVTVDCAKDRARCGGSGKPLAKRLYRACLLVLAKRDRDFVAGLLLIRF